MKEALVDLLTGDNGIAFPEQWFDRELRDSFGFDVFSETFKHRQGYQIMKQNSLSLLVLRMEDLDWALPEAIGAFLNIYPSEIRLKRANEGAQKWYAEVYAKVNESLKLPPKVAGRVLNTRYCKHFYPAEHDYMLNKWRNQPCFDD